MAAGFTFNADAVDIRAWINMDGTGTIAITDDYNVSSITDGATGDYIINYSVNMSTTTYCLAGFVGGAALNVIGGRDVIGYNLVGSTRIGVRDANTENWVDNSLVNLAVIGN